MALVAEVRWARRHLSVARHGPGPLCFVSSGLGDARVAARLDLFEEMVAGPGPTAALQDAFHRHEWPERPEISVMMRRTEARTVSVTTLEVEARGDRWRPEMAYEAVPEGAVVVRGHPRIGRPGAV